MTARNWIKHIAGLGGRNQSSFRGLVFLAFANAFRVQRVIMLSVRIKFLNFVERCEILLCLKRA